MFINYLLDASRQGLAAFRALLVFTVILGIAYPVAVWGAGQAFGDKAAGQPVLANGRVVGSALLGQTFNGNQWFHGRPSAVDNDTLASAPSNLGPSNPELIDLINERRTHVAKEEGVLANQVPADALTASGSGLDPHISVAYAQLQAPRVADVAGLPIERVRSLITKHTQGRTLGFLGEPGVNVVKLNLDIASTRQ